MTEQRIELGDSAKDIISGFEGVVIAATEWLYACRQLTLQPQELDKNSGRPKDPKSFDEPQLVLVKRGVVQVPSTFRRGEPVAAAQIGGAHAQQKTGGPAREPVLRSGPCGR